jgi:hypothetical protein
MEINLLVLIGICLAAMFFGYFFGLFEGRSQGYKKGKREGSEDKKILPPVVTPPASKENNLLKLSLDDKNQLRLDLDNRSMDANQLAPDQRQRLIELMVMMRPWVDVNASKPSTPIAATTSQPISKPIATAPASSPVEEAKVPQTMVGQIDAILQAHLINTPLASRNVKLIESPGGGVIVMVGKERYNGVGEVTDPQVQAAIRAAIAEWETKYTPR